MAPRKPKSPPVSRGSRRCADKRNKKQPVPLPAKDPTTETGAPAINLTAEFVPYASAHPVDESNERLATAEGLRSISIISAAPVGVSDADKSNAAIWSGKSFDQRYRFAWWRFVDPYAGFAKFLDWCQRVMHEAALVLHEVRARLRSNFEKLVVDRAELDIRDSVTRCLDFYRRRGYAIKPGTENLIRIDLIEALASDAGFANQMRELQLMEPSRKALYYRIWALWDVKAKYLSSIVHDQVTKGGN